jgi:hypothetical protein
MPGAAMAQPEQVTSSYGCFLIPTSESIPFGRNYLYVHNMHQDLLCKRDYLAINQVGFISYRKWRLKLNKR